MTTIKLSQIPRIAKNWDVEQLVNWCLENNITEIVNDKLPLHNQQSYELYKFIAIDYLWETLQRLI